MASTAACASRSLTLTSSFMGQRESLNNRREVRGARVVAMASRNSAVRGAEEKGFFDWLANTALTKGEALNEKNPLFKKVENGEVPRTAAPKAKAPAKKAESTGFNFGGFGKK
eukprot:TRINITY_DN18806_c0_g1_i1.p1 TRINITY_DN18806_c0_g1~~TRINITY_DN18806_c0_g1_i1.p1  ORF type:complete len:113 (-),score=20.61 TRINITY_DN18806_c0_g1_i1:590-928(-)